MHELSIHAFEHMQYLSGRQTRWVALAGFLLGVLAASVTAALRYSSAWWIAVVVLLIPHGYALEQSFNIAKERQVIHEHLCQYLEEQHILMDACLEGQLLANQMLEGNLAVWSAVMGPDELN